MSERPPKRSRRISPPPPLPFCPPQLCALEQALHALKDSKKKKVAHCGTKTKRLPQVTGHTLSSSQEAAGLEVGLVSRTATEDIARILG